MENEVLKVLIDEKAAKIVDLTKDKSMTTKELAKAMGVKNSNLYYPIKKLLEVNALKVVEERQIKNMTEYYYSSEHLEDEALNFEYPFMIENFDKLEAINMMQIRKVFDVMRYDIERNLGKSEKELKELKEQNNSQLSTMTAELDYQTWMDMMKEMREVVRKYNKQAEAKRKATNNDEVFEDEKKYSIILAAYREDVLEEEEN